MSEPRVETFRSLEAVGALRDRIDALNLASRRPCPFATYEYLEAFAAHDEYAARDDEVLFLAAFDGDTLVGYLPLKRTREKIFGLPFRRIGLMLTHDTDRPHVVARAEDEARCARAFYRHLFEREKGWSFLELGMQDAESALGATPELAPARFRVRRFDTMPNSTVPLAYASFADYWHTIESGHRRNMQRLCRRLLAAGKVEVVSCTDARGRPAMLELYLDLERRSWKEAAHAGIRRDARRIELFRELCLPEQPMQIGFDFVLLDDLPVSGLVSGAFDGALHGLETAYDREHEPLAPGHLLTMMAIRRGIAGRFRSFNFNGNYAYYKAKIGAVVTPTSAVQIYKVGSVPWLKARAGDLRRALASGAEAKGRFNPERRRAEQGEPTAEPKKASQEHAPIPPRLEERGLARDMMRALERANVRIERLSGDALEAALPFTVKREAA